MSHITGLFARRAFNLEAIICVPEPGRATSRMLLLVADDPKLGQSCGSLRSCTMCSRSGIGRS
jgi:acetolactate synthase small subunit